MMKVVIDYLIFSFNQLPSLVVLFRLCGQITMQYRDLCVYNKQLHAVMITTMDCGPPPGLAFLPLSDALLVRLAIRPEKTF